MKKIITQLFIDWNMLTKKDLIERLKDVPDDALIGAMVTRNGLCYAIYWGEDNNFSFCNDFLKDAAVIPMSNQFRFSDLRK